MLFSRVQLDVTDTSCNQMKITWSSLALLNLLLILFCRQWRRQWGSRGAECPPNSKKLPKRGERRGKSGKEGEIGKKRYSWEEKARVFTPSLYASACRVYRYGSHRNFIMKVTIYGCYKNDSFLFFSFNPQWTNHHLWSIGIIWGLEAFIL